MDNQKCPPGSSRDDSLHSKKCSSSFPSQNSNLKSSKEPINECDDEISRYQCPPKLASGGDRFGLEAKTENFPPLADEPDLWDLIPRVPKVELCLI